MNKIFAPFLPPWAETGLQPAFYDVESGTVLQQTARMYNKVNQLTRLFNEFSEATSEEVNAFEREVNDTVAEYIEKFTELKDFVDNYFDNLDVQEEIDHKLDEMLEDGVLQEIIATYLDSNVAWTFDSVAEMQTATNLTSDSYAQTYGFYTVGDGGGAKYKIRNKGVSEVADNIFTFEIGDDLIAEYVYKGVYCTKQLGVKADGSVDVSAKLQAIIDKIDTENLANTDSYTPLTFDSGVYKIDSQIELSVNVPLKANGLVTIKSYVDNASCLWIKPKAGDPDNWYSRTEEYISGDGFILEYAGENSGYGLEISTTTNLGAYKGFMHSKIENITFKFFAIALKINPVHVFCDTFERLQFEQCDKQVQWGTNGFTLIDSGERITFNDCQFGGNHAVVFELNNIIASMFVTASSMDYCDCVFDGTNTTGYSNVYVDNCHIEGITYGMTDADKLTKPYGIIYGNFRFSEFAFTNGQIGVRPRGYLFTYLSDDLPVENKYRVIIDNMMIGTPDSSNTPSNLYIAAPNVNISTEGITGNPLLVAVRVSTLENVIPYSLFEGETVGTRTVNTTTDSNVSGSTIVALQSVASTATIYENSATGGKGIKFTTTANNPAIQIRSPKFDVKSGEKLYASAAFTNFNNVQINIEFYDITDTIISTFTKTPTKEGTPSTTDTFLPQLFVATCVPKNAVKASVRLVTNRDGRTYAANDEVCIDGFYCFKG